MKKAIVQWLTCFFTKKRYNISTLLEEGLYGWFFVHWRHFYCPRAFGDRAYVLVLPTWRGADTNNALGVSN